MACILVTGGAGFIGSHLVVRLVESGHRVRVLDDFSTGRHENIAEVLSRIELFEADVRDREACLRACAGAEFVLHEAAIPSVPKSVEDPQPSHDANVSGTFNLLRAAVEHRVRRFIYAASSSAYGDTVESPKHEGIIPRPLSPYAVQKLTGELYARAFCECYGLETISLRYFNVFGARQDPKSQYAAAIPAFVTRMLRGQPPVVYGDGTQTRDFTYIDNVVHGNMLAIQMTRACGESVNIASGTAVSVNQVISEVNRRLGGTLQPEYAARRPGDVMHSCADITLAGKLLGFKPVVKFEDGLDMAIDYYRTLV
ncbi:MAG: SDR family oxidoreductase [Phycisphaerae bacterium]